MTKDAFRLTSPGGTEMELPIRQGTTGPLWLRCASDGNVVCCRRVDVCLLS